MHKEGHSAPGTEWEFLARHPPPKSLPMGVDLPGGSWGGVSRHPRVDY